MTRDSLKFGVKGKTAFRFRAITGLDERQSGGCAHRLLKIVSRRGPNLVAGADFDTVPLCDRDRALANLFATLYGDEIRTNTVCNECKNRFDINFCLSDLVSSELGAIPTGNAFLHDKADTIRLPTYADIRGHCGQPVTELLNALVTESSTAHWSADRIQRVADALQQANPVLDVDLTADCPECRRRSTFRFSIAQYFDGVLRNERSLLWREVHLLANQYGWSLDKLLDLTRVERHALVKLVLNERGISTAMRKSA